MKFLSSYTGHMRRPATSERAKNPVNTSWTFLTNHAHVLLCIAQDPVVRLAEIAKMVGIGERSVHSIVCDLVDAGYVVRSRQGRHNVYEVNMDRPLRHPLEADHDISEIFRPLTHRTSRSA